MILQRLITFKPEDLVLHRLYTTHDGPGPNTKARRRGEVEGLVRTGLRQALETLEGAVEVIGTSGCQTREDIISTDAGKAIRR